MLYSVFLMSITRKNEQTGDYREGREWSFVHFSTLKKDPFLQPSSPSCLIHLSGSSRYHSDDVLYLWLKYHLVTNAVVFFLSFSIIAVQLLLFW